ncbi:MAG: glycosyltransferase [Planctomycetes bacterium]|nr:glycosyltransferase [Planctomycetota bacterium]
MQEKFSNKYPLVSIFCFCKNRKQAIRRCIDSIVAQDYPNIEIIVQDGVSTDGTLEILQEYGNKIKLVSEPDSGPLDGFFRCLKRIKGEFFGSCLSDEELLPHAASWAVENLRNHPDVAGIYGDFSLTDIEGNVIRKKHTPSQWNFEKYLCYGTSPPFCSSFFRRACYEAIGFREYTADDEFDFWINLGAKFPIRYMPGLVSKYAIHPDQSGSQKDLPEKRFASRKSAIEKLCNNTQTPKWIRLLRDKAIAGLYPWRAIYYCTIGAWDLAKEHAPEAFRIGPNSEKLIELAELLYRHSKELYKKGQFEQALEYLDLVISHKVADENFNGQRANILFKLGRISEAVKASYEQLKLQPDHRRSKAIIQLVQNYSEDIAQSHNEKLAKELFKMGTKYLSQGDTIEAIKHFEEAAADSTTIPELHYAIAIGYSQLGNIPSAIKACEAELKLQPEHNGVMQLLGQIKKAIAEFTQSQASSTEAKVKITK